MRHSLATGLLDRKFRDMIFAFVASLFALLVIARAQDTCSTASKGNKWINVHAKELHTVFLPTATNIYVIEDYACGGYGSNHVGTEVTACSIGSDDAPSVALVDLQHVVAGNRPGIAPTALYITIFCQYVVPPPHVLWRRVGARRSPIAPTVTAV